MWEVSSLNTFHFVQWALAALSAITVGMSKGGFVGASLVSIVVMAHVLPAKASTGVILPMFLTGDVLAVVLFRRHTLWRYVLSLLPAAVAGVVCGAWLMNHIPSAIFGPVLGALILFFTGLMFIQRAAGDYIVRLAQYPRVALLCGWFAGVTTMLANASGPIMTVYLLACKLPKMQFVGTLAWFFFLLNLSKLPFSTGMGLINKESLLLNLVLVPCVLLGVLAGRRLISAFSQSAFEIMLLLFTLVGGLSLLIGR